MGVVAVSIVVALLSTGPFVAAELESADGVGVSVHVVVGPLTSLVVLHPVLRPFVSS